MIPLLFFITYSIVCRVDFEYNKIHGFIGYNLLFHPFLSVKEEFGVY
jgi:hypothetical protein